MLCEPYSSENEYKDIDELNSNCIVNMVNLTTNIDKYLVCLQCAKRGDLQIII